MFDRRLHPPALVAETIEFLRLKDLREGVVCDMTLGTAGHALAMLEVKPEPHAGRHRPGRGVADRRPKPTGVGWRVGPLPPGTGRLSRPERAP